MWRYYVLGGNREVLFFTDSRKDAVAKARELTWLRGTGASACVVVRSLFRYELDTVRKDDV
jgi:hypothetical protein